MAKMEHQNSTLNGRLLNLLKKMETENRRNFQVDEKDETQAKSSEQRNETAQQQQQQPQIKKV